ncbi:MAG: nucleotidyltransferase domain-containing protein [Zestosphaera sp.]
MSPVPRHKVQRAPEFREVIYGPATWELLRRLRVKAIKIVEALNGCGFNAIVHGSLARGDVTPSSDVDVVITYLIQPYRAVLCLEDSGFTIYKQYVVKATPAATPKAYMELDADGKEVVSFPLQETTNTEWEFYRFGGTVALHELRSGVRVPGVNKNLVLIIPTDRGHIEAPVIDYEAYVASILGVSINVVHERVRLLTRRDRLGRTGTYLTYVLKTNESFEEALTKLKKEGKLTL